MRSDSTDIAAQNFVALLEELMDLKIQRYAETHLKLPTELTHLLQAKRETDRRRLEQIKENLVRMLTQQDPCLPREP